MHQRLCALWGQFKGEDYYVPSDRKFKLNCFGIIDRVSNYDGFIMAGWGCKQSGAPNNDIITVDVTANYPKKELILQDFMDVDTFRWKPRMNLFARALYRISVKILS
jgi:hypothetical protein